MTHKCKRKCSGSAADSIRAKRNDFPSFSFIFYKFCSEGCRWICCNLHGETKWQSNRLLVEDINMIDDGEEVYTY